MGEAIGEILPMAVGVGLSPIPIVAVVVILGTPRARANGPAFLVGWLAGLTVVGVVVALVAGAASANGNGEPATWVDVVKLLLGLLLVGLAVKQWVARPRREEQAEPKWMATVDEFGPGKTAGAGVVLSTANPKNLILAAAAAAEIAQLGLPGGDEAVAYAAFVLIGTIGVGVPVAIYFGLSTRAGPMLHGLKDWMSRNNAVIMAVILLLLGAKLVGDAITGFSS